MGKATEAIPHSLCQPWLRPGLQSTWVQNQLQRSLCDTKTCHISLLPEREEEEPGALTSP